MDSSNKESIIIFHKLNPIDSFRNWTQNQPNKNNNFFDKWRINNEKRFYAPEQKRFSTKRQETETGILGQGGAGAGVGCGVGVGFGLVGGIGVGSGPWNQVSPVVGLGFGCGVGAGFGYGVGLGYGSSWKSIKEDVLGFKEKSKKKNHHKRSVADW